MKTLALTLALAALAAPAAAQDFSAALQGFYDSELQALAHDAGVLAAVRAQNEANAGMTQEQINQRDADWASELGQGTQPLVSGVLNNALAEQMRAFVAESGGRVTEIIVMDNRGMNVAVTTVTSDYWQGDEAKFRDTYLVGADALHFSEIELDESTGRYQAQISFTVSDEATGESLGAVTVGVDAELL